MMHNMNNNDLRVKRTQKLIVDALIALTIKHGFSSITVSDITKFAGINRATFYRHYKDKFDVLDKYAQNVYELLDNPIEKSQKIHQNTHQMPENLVRIFEHVREYATFYRVMLGKHGDPGFTEKIRQYIQKRIWRTLPDSLQTKNLSIDLYVQYSSSASLGAILWWLEHDMPYSSEEMMQILFQLESGNLQAMLKK